MKGNSGTYCILFLLSFVPLLAILPLPASAAGPSSSYPMAGPSRWETFVGLTDMTPENGTTGDAFEFKAMIDPPSITSINVEYWLETVGQFNTTMTISEPKIWTYSIILPPDSLEPFAYRFHINETTGKWYSSDWVFVEVFDNDPPAFDLSVLFTAPVKGLPFKLNVKVIDNIELHEVNAHYRFGDEEWENATMTASDLNHTCIVQVPRSPSGDMRVWFDARDRSGNINSSALRNLSPINHPPYISDMPAWNLIEDKEGTFDVAPYLIDGNDPVTSLVLTVSDPRVMVEDKVLRATFDRSSIWALTLNVSDGEDTSQAELTVNVSSPNRLPKIRSTPPRYAEVDRHYRYQVVFTDEDLQDDHILEFNQRPAGMLLLEGWVIDWVPRKKQVGLQHVDIGISDGTGKVYQNWTVIVNKTVREENLPPMFVGGPPFNISAGEALDWKADVIDPEGDALFYSLLIGPEGAVIDNETGSLRWVPGIVQKGSFRDHVFLISVNDTHQEVFLNFTVRVHYPPNLPPMIIGLPEARKVGKEFKIDLSKSKNDPDDTISSLEWGIEGDFLDDFWYRFEDESLILTPKKGASGVYEMTLVLYDPQGLVDTEDFQIEVEAEEEGRSNLVIWIFGSLLLILIVSLVALYLWNNYKKGKGADQGKGKKAQPLHKSDSPAAPLAKLEKKDVPLSTNQ